MGFLSTYTILTKTKAGLIFLIASTIIGSLGLYSYIHVPKMSVLECAPPRLYSSIPPTGPKYAGHPTLNYHKNYTRNKFTVVMPTYKRNLQLLVVIGHYCNISNVHKILVLWNNVGETVPGPIKDFKCQVPVEIKIMKENKLTSRFRPYPEIETEGIARKNMN